MKFMYEIVIFDKDGHYVGNLHMVFKETKNAKEYLNILPKFENLNLSICRVPIQDEE